VRCYRYIILSPAYVLREERKHPKTGGYRPAGQLLVVVRECIVIAMISLWRIRNRIYQRGPEKNSNSALLKPKYLGEAEDEDHSHEYI